MQIRNTGAKVINIGNIILMPDETITVSDRVGASRSIQAFIRKGYLMEVEEPKSAKKAAAGNRKAAAGKAAEKNPPAKAAAAPAGKTAAGGGTPGADTAGAGAAGRQG